MLLRRGSKRVAVGVVPPNGDGAGMPESMPRLAGGFHERADCGECAALAGAERKARYPGLRFASPRATARSRLRRCGGRVSRCGMVPGFVGEGTGRMGRIGRIGRGAGDAAFVLWVR